MNETKVLQIKAEDLGLKVTAISPPSFTDRLNLSDFAFNALPTESLRRSRRVLTPKLEPSNTPAPIRVVKRNRKTDSPSVSSSSSSSPRRIRSRTPAGYAPPSQYAHLNELVDILEPNLICAFVGLNPGIRTAIEGHAYSHRSNRFWKLLHSSGLTNKLMLPAEDRTLPTLGLGNTNIVSRPTRNGAELSKQEMDDSVVVLDEKMRMFKPEVVCIVGKSIWESIWRTRHGSAIKKEEFRYGWQDESENIGLPTDVKEEEHAYRKTWNGAKVFVATSTSGLAATPPMAEKEKIWRDLGTWVEHRRTEKAAAGTGVIIGGAAEQALPN